MDQLLQDKKMKNLTHEEKLQWMAYWAAKKGLRLVLEGECGFGRPCVGVEIDGHYPEHQWEFDPERCEYNCYESKLVDNTRLY